MRRTTPSEADPSYTRLRILREALRLKDEPGLDDKIRDLLRILTVPPEVQNDPAADFWNPQASENERQEILEEAAEAAKRPNPTPLGKVLSYLLNPQQDTPQQPRQEASRPSQGPGAPPGQARTAEEEDTRVPVAVLANALGAGGDSDIEVALAKYLDIHYPHLREIRTTAAAATLRRKTAHRRKRETRFEDDVSGKVRRLKPLSLAEAHAAIPTWHALPRDLQVLMQPLGMKRVQPSRAVQTLLVLHDCSGSMYGSTGGGAFRGADLALSILMDRIAEVQRGEAELIWIAFGDGAHPPLHITAENAEAQVEAISIATDPPRNLRGDTHTYLALRRAFDYLSALPHRHRPDLLLITDGLPSDTASRAPHPHDWRRINCRVNLLQLVESEVMDRFEPSALSKALDLQEYARATSGIVTEFAGP